jgi:hypothetical protein
MTDPKPDDFNAKVEKIAGDAMEAGKKFAATDTGKKVTDATDSAFQTASEMGQKIADSDLAKQALASEPGKQVVGFAKQADEWTKSTIPNTLARNVAVGAAAGAVVAIPIPFIGPIIGAIIGGGLGYLRTITKKS